MNKLIVLTASLLAACQSNAVPQSFDDLLHITDATTDSICTLPLADIRQTLTPAELEAAKKLAFDYDFLAAEHADNPALQISILLRRAALKRRLNVASDELALAETYYAEFDDGVEAPKSLAEYQTKFQYWAARVSEQGQHESPESDDYNLRFCVLNEARAAVHSGSRSFILAKLSDASLPLSTETLEVIRSNDFYGDAFQKLTIDRLFSDESLRAKLSPLELGLIRGDALFLPFDSKVSAAHWAARDKEIDALLAHISTHAYETPAAKLVHMTMIDQNLRKLWSLPPENSHFETQEEFENFRKGVSERVTKVDEFNTAEIQKMLKGRGWFRDDKDGEGAGRYGWLIAQHADRNPTFQQAALKLMKAELGAPGVSKSNYAYLYDRVQMRFMDSDGLDERIQRYGIQGRCTGPGTWEPLPMEDPENIDARRAEVGLGPIAEYKVRFKTLCTKDER